MKSLEFNQMENIQGGSDAAGCALGVASIALGVVGMATGIGAVFALAAWGTFISTASTLPACFG